MLKQEVSFNLDIFFRHLHIHCYDTLNILFHAPLFSLLIHVYANIYHIFDYYFFQLWYLFDLWSHAFKEIGEIHFFELTESFRQEEDQKFCELLNNIRIGKNLESTIDQINSQCFDPTLESDFFMTLTSRKKRAEELNEYKLGHIEGEEEVIKSKVY